MGAGKGAGSNATDGGSYCACEDIEGSNSFLIRFDGSTPHPYDLPRRMH